jgi:glycosyltransferase involved in cell wall biosynthesis
MIVKNESKVILRCLASLKDLIDHWVIVDTGSSDGTQEIIRDFLKDVPGQLIERPWVDFGQNRTEALQLARGKGDYLLTIDADEILMREPDFSLPMLTADSYLLELESGPLSYYKCQLARNALDWRYKGVLHEYIFCPAAQSQAVLPGLKIIRYLDGARSSDPQKFQKDALELEQALLTEPDNERHVFYLAQSYRDAGYLNRAIENYEKRISMGGWHEECWYSMYQIAVLKHQRGDAWPEVQHAYLSGYQFRSNRAEPLHKLVSYYSAQGQFQLAYLYGKQAMAIPYPKHDLLFLEKPLYDYALAIDFAVACYWIGDHASAIRVNNALLSSPLLPGTLFGRVLENRRFSLKARYTKTEVAPGKPNKIKVCISFHNPGSSLDNCIESLLNQDYPNFEAIFIDDASTDGSPLRIPTDDPRITLVCNERRRYALRNAHSFLTKYCEPDDIAVFLDGDDWLACDGALSKISDLYDRYDCWVLYGQFRFLSTGRYGVSMPYADAEHFKTLRQHWYSSHIRTFRAGVYQKIKEQDPDYECMLDERDHWYQTAADLAVMYPVLELAGFERVCFNDEVLYVYNDESPLNDHRCNAAQQQRDTEHIRARKPFQQIYSLHLTGQTRKRKRMTPAVEFGALS